MCGAIAVRYGTVRYGECVKFDHNTVLLILLKIHKMIKKSRIQNNIFKVRMKAFCNRNMHKKMQLTGRNLNQLKKIKV